MAATRRVGTENSATRTVILDTTERLMIEEGYAAVSTRRVAAEAGLKPALVHYYFVTTDDLFLAAYRRVADKYFEMVSAALASPRPLAAFWELSMNATRTTLAVEFMALANHRKVIRAEIARNIERTREVHSQFLVRLPPHPTQEAAKHCPPTAVSLMMAALSRALVMEGALGVSAGHAEAEAFARWWIKHAETPASQPKRVKAAGLSPRRRPRARR